jgi:hypothetical protein
MIDFVTQWVAIFIICSGEQICAVQNSEEPYWRQERCLRIVKESIEVVRRDLPDDYTINGTCVKIKTGIKI